MFSSPKAFNSTLQLLHNHNYNPLRTHYLSPSLHNRDRATLFSFASKDSTPGKDSSSLTDLLLDEMAGSFVGAMLQIGRAHV